MMANMKIKVLLAVLAGSLLLGACRSTKELGAESRPAEAAAKTECPKDDKPQTAATFGQAAPQEEPAREQAPQEAAPAFHPRMPGWRIANVSVPGPYVALTFDDGPDEVCTPQVLDILKRYKAKATFFVVGWRAAAHPQILARAVNEGHEIGNHTWNHPQLPRISKERMHAEIERTSRAIQQATGREPAVMRPPYGATNPALIHTIVKDHGMVSILWDVETQDWRHPGVSVVQRRAVGNAHNGSIILLHDIHHSTVEAVEGIVKGLQERGFTLVTVSELIEMGRRAAREANLPEPPPPADIHEEKPAEPAADSAAPPAAESKEAESTEPPVAPEDKKVVQKTAKPAPAKSTKKKVVKAVTPPAAAKVEKTPAATRGERKSVWSRLKFWSRSRAEKPAAKTTNKKR